MFANILKDFQEKVHDVNKQHSRQKKYWIQLDMAQKIDNMTIGMGGK